MNRKRFSSEQLKQHYKDYEARPEVRQNRINWHLLNREKVRAERYITNHHIPLAKFCETCPPEEVNKATQHHHPDPCIQWLFISCCASCHYYLNHSTSLIEL